MAAKHPSGSAELASTRDHGYPSVAVGLLLGTVFLLSLAAGACSRSQGVLSIADRNSFTESANAFISETNSALSTMNAAASAGDFSSVRSQLESQLAAVVETTSQMESKASKLSGEPRAVADQMVSTAKDWHTHAREAMNAGLAADSNAYSTHISAANDAADRFNSLVTRWNSLEVK